MANNYVKSSFVFEVTSEQAEFAKGIYDAASHGDFQPVEMMEKEDYALDGVSKESIKGLRSYIEYLDFDHYDLSCFSMDFDLIVEEGGLWLSHDESIDIENAAYFCSFIMKHFDMDTFLSVTAAFICSKPRLNEFGGTAAFITKDGVDWLSMDNWLNQKEKEFSEKAA